MCLDLKRLPGCRALCSAYELGMLMAASSHKLAYLTEATVFTSVSPVLMGVDALHQLKNAIFKKCVWGGVWLRGQSRIPWSWSYDLPDMGFRNLICVLCKNRT